jgi:hypothetical protein
MVVKVVKLIKKVFGHKYDPADEVKVVKFGEYEKNGETYYNLKLIGPTDIRYSKHRASQLIRTKFGYRPVNKKNIGVHKKVIELFGQNGFELIGNPKTVNFYKREGKHSVTNTEFNIKPLPFTQGNADIISDGCINLLNQEKVKAQKIHHGGFNVYMKLLLSTSEIDTKGKENIKSLVINGNITKNVLYNKLVQESSKMYSTQDYILTLWQVQIALFPLAVKGGCSDNKKCENVKKSKYEKIKLVNLKSKNNNCLIACLNHIYEVKGNKNISDIVRRANDLELNEMIDFNQIPKLVLYYNNTYDKDFGYHVINEKNETILLNHKNINANIYLKGEHYFVWESINFKKCRTCGRVTKFENEIHKCNLNRSRFYNNPKTKCKTDNFDNFVQKKEIEDDEKLNYNDVVYWDLETFQEINKHEVYASGWMNEDVYRVEYGKDAIDLTIDEFIGFENKIITAYNGSSFDFYFLIDQLTARGINIDNDSFIVNNGKLISFKYGTNRVFDLYLFVMTSLDKACKDFKIENAKSSFQHEKMKTWDDIEKYKNEVIPYLKIDVLALKELFETFNDMFYELFKTNITKYVTASHMGYCIWSSLLNDVVEIPDNMEKYHFIKKATFGGRCCPMKKEFKSKHYDDIVQGKMNYDELLGTNDFIFNADVTSLYPASMRGNDLIDVYYPTGSSRWSSKPEDEFNLGKVGFYEVEYICPKNITVPILPKRKMNGEVCIGVEWDLFDGSGVFCSVDIQNAIENNYTFKFINKALVYDSKSSNVFSKYIDVFYKLKETAEKEGNKVKRSIAKLMLNALYGKTLQKANFSTSKIINDVFEFNKFVLDYDLEDYTFINDNKMLVTGTSKEKETKITKPSQLGAFVTAYSRRFMLYFMKQIDPTLTSIIFTYTDTDSLHITGEAYKLLKEKGLIVNKEDAKLGYMCSDIDDEGIIIYEKNLAPKTYMYEYITSENIININDKCTMKAKGIPKKDPFTKEILLTQDMYIEERAEKPISFNGLKKVHKTVTKKQKENGISNFSVLNNTQTRTFNKSSWGGFDFINGCWLPKNYQA